MEMVTDTGSQAQTVRREPPADGWDAADLLTTGDAGDADGLYIISRPTDQPIEPVTAEPLDPNPAFLDISDAERAFMVAMAGLIGSPRAAKRFVNIYRLLKASFEERLDGQAAPDLGERQHQAPMLMLAILTGYPAEAMDLFDDLLGAPPSESWWSFVERELAPATVPSGNGHGQTGVPNGSQRPAAFSRNGADESDDERRAELTEKLLQIRDANVIAADHTCEDFINWVPHVARYSYLSRNLLLRHAAERRGELMSALVG
jgi:hypothetical protein